MTDLTKDEVRAIAKAAADEATALVLAALSEGTLTEGALFDENYVEVPGTVCANGTVTGATATLDGQTLDGRKLEP